MPTIIVCGKCGTSPAEFGDDDAELGLLPDDDCDACDGFYWEIIDVDASELEDDSDDWEDEFEAQDEDLDDDDDGDRWWKFWG